MAITSSSSDLYGEIYLDPPERRRSDEEQASIDAECREEIRRLNQELEDDDIRRQ